MTPVSSDFALDALHDTATEIFTGAVSACNIASAFDRRFRFEGNKIHRLLPDGSGPESFCLSDYKKIMVIALGKAAAPMLEVLMDRMHRRLGLRGICCSNQLPRRRDWRFRYFEGGHPTPNEDSFAAARATLAMLRGEQGPHADEIDRLVQWLADSEKPDIVHLSNALLIGMARRFTGSPRPGIRPWPSCGRLARSGRPWCSSWITASR